MQGPDTQTFLQGQTTCDLAELNMESALTGAYCTPQGRVVADFRILGCGEESWLLQMHRDICNNTAAVFGKYIVFSKAEVANASEDWRQFAAWGAGAGALLGCPENQKHRVWQRGDTYWVQTDAAGERFECCVRTGNADALQAQLAADFEACPEPAWQLAEINAGDAHLEPATVEMFLPQMLNFQLTERISFSKGCYTGQEVIARLHYRGKLKRPMYRARVQITQIPAAGETLYTADNSQSVGNIVNSSADGSGVSILAVVASDAIGSGIHLGSQQGPELEFLTLPYDPAESA
jgi:folate-binding protein YgfZ